MIERGFLQFIDSKLKILIGVFSIVLSIGFFTGINFVNFTTGATPTGVEENYNGNEDDMEADVMKFKKSEHEMLNILHTHFLSLSVVFLILGMLVYGSKAPDWLHSFLLLEPMISVLLTFGGIYFLWLDILWMKYIVIISGVLMTVSFALSIFFILRTLFLRKVV